jgi:SAM-dependent methyltransferase
MGKNGDSLLGICNLCNGLVIKVNSSYFGYRCIKCHSTQIHRAICAVINNQFGAKMKNTEIRAYELSSRGALFKFMKRKFPNLIYSEYYEDVKPGEYKNGVQCQDVQQLTFADATFDLVTSTEVFEHVIKDQEGFREVFRVLAPGGKFIFTVPLSEVDTTVERAYMDEQGNIVHVLPPEYHGDRIRGQNQVLAFRNYGLDIVTRLKNAGFNEVFIERPFSSKYKITQKQVICAIKA